MIRRPLRALALAPLTVLAIAAPAFAESKLVPLDKVFPYLEGYLKLAPAERSRFVLTYRLVGDVKQMTSVHAALVDKGRASPVPLGADGRFERLPTLREFQDAAQLSLEAAKGTRLGLSMTVEPVARPAPEMDAQDLAATILQAQAGEQKLAGLFAFAAPKLTRAAFEGVKSGEAVGADGKARALPLEKGRPVFDPAAMKGVRILRFPNAPSRAELIPQG